MCAFGRRGGAARRRKERNTTMRRLNHGEPKRARESKNFEELDLSGSGLAEAGGLAVAEPSPVETSSAVRLWRQTWPREGGTPSRGARLAGRGVSQQPPEDPNFQDTTLVPRTGG